METKCIVCKKELECDCFKTIVEDIEKGADYELPFCSFECLEKYEETNYIGLEVHNTHLTDCKNQFGVKNKEQKRLIKQLQREREVWEKTALDISKKYHQRIRKVYPKKSKENV